MKQTFFFLFVFLLGVFCFEHGEVTYTNSFETTEEQNEFSSHQYASFVKEGTNTVFKMNVPSLAEGSGKTNFARKDLNIEDYRGLKISLQCLSKAESVSQPQQTWNGVKFMLVYQSNSKGTQYIGPSNEYGTFDWKKLIFSVTIADDATDGQLILGLQDSFGTIWFDDISITVRSFVPIKPNQPAMYKGHNLPRLRGVMSPHIQNIEDEDMRVLGEEWNANVIRLQIQRNWGTQGSERNRTDYNLWINEQLDAIETVLPLCEKYGILAVVDLHTPPGGRDVIDGIKNQMVMYFEEEYAQDFIEIWKKIASRFKNNKNIWGFDLVNEPVSGDPETCLDLIAEAAKEVRKIDPTTTILIPSCEWGGPSTFQYMKTLDIPNLVYQVHMYVPGEYTHQGLHEIPIGTEYPGLIHSTYWNITKLKEKLDDVRQFSLYHNVHIYVGEFSAIRYAPGASKYLSDVIEIFEEYGWDYTYHAYREFTGWSLECSNDINDSIPSNKTNDRKEAVLGWFAKNLHPGDIDELGDNSGLITGIAIATSIFLVFACISLFIIMIIIFIILGFAFSRKKKEETELQLNEKI